MAPQQRGKRFTGRPCLASCSAAAAAARHVPLAAGSSGACAATRGACLLAGATCQRWEVRGVKGWAVTVGAGTLLAACASGPARRAGALPARAAH